MPYPETPQPQQPQDSRLVRLLLQAVAVLGLVLAVIGAVLPIMPTVPFVLLSAWAAARSSPRLAAWLEGHPRFGPAIREWRQGGIVRRPAKWASTGAMSFSAVVILFIVPNPYAAAAAILTLVCVGVWIWLRPERIPRDEETAVPED